MASPRRLLQLTKLIQEKTKEVDSFIQENNLPEPSFDPSYPPAFNLPPKADAARNAALEAIDELKAHLLGPVGVLYEDTVNFAGPHQYFRVTRRLFRLNLDGTLGHTAATQAMATTPHIRDFVDCICTDIWPTAPRYVDVMQKWPGSQEPNETGFNLAFNTESTFFAELEKDEKRFRNFADAMRFFLETPAMKPEYAIEGYDWSAHAKGTIVDVGGSHGVIGIKLAERYPDMKIVVQDRPEVIAGAPKDKPKHVDFQAHDFFNEQPVKDTDVYFYRWILHDWSDKYGIAIMRALIPSLKKGARVLLMEAVLPEPGALTPYRAKNIRNFDIAMQLLFNATERTESDWRNLVAKADERFNVVDVKRPEGSQLGIIVVEWAG